MAVEHGRLLEFAADAEVGDFGLVEPGQIVQAVEHGFAGVGAGLAGDDVHHRGLAGAVRADDGAHLARLDGERQIVERAEAVERDGDAVEIEECRGERCSIADPYSAGSGSRTPSSAAAEARSRRSAVQCRSVPMIPRGSSRVTTTNSVAEQEQPVRRQHPGGEIGLGVVDHDRAEHRAGQRTAAADRDPDHRLNGVAGRELARIDDADLRHIERAREARHAGGKREHEQLVGFNPVADEADTGLGIANGDQHLAELRGDDGAAQQEARG